MLPKKETKSFNEKPQQLSLRFDTKRCMGCYACEVACKQEHDLPVGPRLIRVIQFGPTEVDGKLRMDFVPTTCIQCKNPSCMAICPVDAISKDERTGVVLIDKCSCIGCKLCLEACTFGVVQFDHTNRVALKCDLCMERTVRDLKPSCVVHCPAEAITLHSR